MDTRFMPEADDSDPWGSYGVIDRGARGRTIGVDVTDVTRTC
jgi:hypothetical protein